MSEVKKDGCADVLGQKFDVIRPSTLGAYSMFSVRLPVSVVTYFYFDLILSSLTYRVDPLHDITQFKTVIMRVHIWTNTVDVDLCPCECI